MAIHLYQEEVSDQTGLIHFGLKTVSRALRWDFGESQASSMTNFPNDYKIFAF
jgi:hypothetical protein